MRISIHDSPIRVKVKAARNSPEEVFTLVFRAAIFDRKIILRGPKNAGFLIFRKWAVNIDRKTRRVLFLRLKKYRVKRAIGYKNGRRLW